MKIKYAMGLQNFPAQFNISRKQPSDFKTRPPTFTFIGASSKSLIARGGTGGIAIWTRLNKDIRPAAYGKTNDKEKLN